jgi:DNA polymerase III subunit beta
MHLVRSQENLARGLSAVKTAVAARSSNPILTPILIEARTGESRVRLAATNLDIGINCWIPSQGVEPGAVAVTRGSSSIALARCPRVKSR